MQEDPTLLPALRAGDPNALASLFDAYADRIYYLALRLLKDPAEAEDVVQDTFVKLITKIDTFQGHSTLSTWMYRVAYNACLDRLRIKPEAQLPDESVEPESGPPLPMPEVLVEWQTPEEWLASGEARATLDQAIEQVPEPLRLVFILRDVNELSTAETAEVLGITQNLVKVRLHRARLLLREHLAGYFVERVP